MVSPEWLMSTRISNTMPSLQHNKNTSSICSSPTKPSTLSLEISGPSHRYPQMVLFQWADALRTLRNQKLRQRPSTRIFQLLLVSNKLYVLNSSQTHLTCLYFVRSGQRAQPQVSAAARAIYYQNHDTYVPHLPAAPLQQRVMYATHVMAQPSPQDLQPSLPKYTAANVTAVPTTRHTYTNSMQPGCGSFARAPQPQSPRVVMQQQHQIPQSFQQKLQKSGAIATYDLQNPPKYASYLVKFSFLRSSSNH